MCKSLYGFSFAKRSMGAFCMISQIKRCLLLLYSLFYKRQHIWTKGNVVKSFDLPIPTKSKFANIQFRMLHFVFRFQKMAETTKIWRRLKWVKLFSLFSLEWNFNQPYGWLMNFDNYCFCLPLTRDLTDRKNR